MRNSKNPICGIYKITSPSGRIYIGQSKDCCKRELNYKYNQNKCQIRVHSSITKYGWDAHSFEVIHECLVEELDLFEIHYIKLYKSYGTPLGMNLTTGGCGTRGMVLSQEAKEKIGLGNKGKVVSIEVREKIRKSMTGIKYTDERRENIRKSLTGRKATDRHKKNMSLGMTGKILPKRTPEQTAERIKNHASRRTVLNTQTGIFYFDCKEAADSMGWNYKTLRGKLLGYNKNKTDFIYV